MSALQFSTRVAVLWVAVAVAASGTILLYLLVPGALEEMLAGEMEGTRLNDAVGFQMAMLIVIPVVMAGVTLFVGDRVNRYASLIAGLLFGLLGTFAVVSHLVAGDANGHVLLAGLSTLLAFVIAGLGAVGLRQPEPQARRPAAEGRRPRKKAAV